MRGFLSHETDRGLDIWALVVTDKDEIYRVKKGQYLGTNLGVVTEIDKSGISLVEIVKNAEGYWIEQARQIPFE